MQTIKRVYEPLLDKERVKEIIVLAARGKKKRDEVKIVLADIDHYAERILDMLRSGEFDLKPVRHKTITEKGKQRRIRKFYPSVKSEMLVEFIGRKVKDKRFMRLVCAVVGQCPDLPIGSYYSQWFSNWFLQDVDHYIKERLGVPFYIRYVDDMLLMGNNKRKLLNAMYNIERKLAEKGLELKQYKQVKRWETAPIDFLGFRFGEEVRARGAIFRRLTKLLRKVRKRAHVALSQARALLAYIGWARYLTRGYAFYNNHIKPFAPKGVLRRMISNYDRRTAVCLH